MTGTFHAKRQATSRRRKRWFVKEGQENSIMKVTGRMRMHDERLSDGNQKKHDEHRRDRERKKAEQLGRRRKNVSTVV
jgi:hypothetical protein